VNRPDVLILRDPRESWKRCSLAPLRGTEGVTFREYRADRTVDATGRILLNHEGPPLTADDAGRDVLLVDSSWRRLPKLLDTVVGEPVVRSLPPLVTAFPRKSRIFDDPDAGLASVEALYAALAILGHPRPELLAEYHFADAFLAANPSLRT
jgi:pre-rRNA-processing protein TSR3